MDNIKSKSDKRTTRHDERRREILEAVVAYVMKHGVFDFSIRTLAESIGLSHGALLNQFGSKEGLLTRVFGEIRRRQQAQLAALVEQEHLDPLALMDLVWQLHGDDEGIDQFIVFNEITAVSMKERDKHPEYLEGVLKGWLQLMAPPLHAVGVPPSRVAVLNTVFLGAMRGLLLDLASTRDRERLDEAYRVLRGMVEREIQRVARARGRTRL